MSTRQIPENLRARPEADRASAHPLGIADPVPVGIAGFAMTTFILSCVNAGFFGGTAATPMVLGLAIFYGGLVQLLALRALTNSTFGRNLIRTWPLS